MPEAKSDHQRYSGQDGRTPGKRGIPSWSLITLALTFAVLLLYVVGNLFASPPSRHQAKIAAAKTDLKGLGNSLKAYRLDTGGYPTTAQGLAALVRQPAGVVGWRGPYVRRSVPLDPWGHAYLYALTGKDKYAVKSLGADGAPGGKGDNADIEERGG